MEKNNGVPIAIKCKGKIYKISKIRSLEHTKEYGYAIEFYDENNMYRYWNQRGDGGYPIFEEE